MLELTATAAELSADAAQMKGGEKAVFIALAPFSVIGAVGMVWARNAIHSALFLVITMLTLGVFYVVNAGPFIGMVQIIVYTGAIMVLFLFVLMLVGRDSSDSLVEVLRGQRKAALLLGVGCAGLLTAGSAHAFTSITYRGISGAEADANVPALAEVLFTRYVVAFEVTSALLITAAVGAMVLAFVSKSAQASLPQVLRSRQRFTQGNYPGPTPGPGVFATTNATDAPALLPDGSTTHESVSDAIEEHPVHERQIETKG